MWKKVKITAPYCIVIKLSLEPGQIEVSHLCTVESVVIDALLAKQGLYLALSCCLWQLATFSAVLGHFLRLPELYCAVPVFRGDSTPFYFIFYPSVPALKSRCSQSLSVFLQLHFLASLPKGSEKERKIPIDTTFQPGPFPGSRIKDALCTKNCTLLENLRVT